MKRSLIAVAAILLLASSVTYAAPVRRPRFFLGPVLLWLGIGHHPQTWAPRPVQHGPRGYAYAPVRRQLPPWAKGRPYWVPGWHWGWQRGQHNGWDHNGPNRGDGRGDRHQDGEHDRGGGRR